MNYHQTLMHFIFELAQGWIVLTKDVNIGRNILEVQQIARYQAQVFVLVSGNTKSGY
jgi:hypothetical protein